MQLENLEDGEVKLGGSFRSLTGGQTGKGVKISLFLACICAIGAYQNPAVLCL